MARNRGDRTKLVSAGIKTDSLRTTVPGSIVRQMKLNSGDQLEWQMESINPEVIRVTIIRSERKPSD
ncbi:MAG: hypothetical protein LVQ63_00605 [Thermoplasmatales archaeon]|nr:hypothetical protein [Thermoplasmatales archaeon]